VGRNEKIRIEELKEQHREYAEIIGVENLIRLAEAYGGAAIYIPKIDDLLKSQKYAAIIREFNGSNVRQLARKYDVSERTVYRLVSGLLKAERLKPLDGQTSLFDRNF
jgi:Mor family transcriptional regulator